MTSSLPVLIVGSGKAGHFFSALLAHRSPCIVSFRTTRIEDWWPQEPSIVILAIRDAGLRDMQNWSSDRSFPPGSAVFHCSGFLDNAPFEEARKHSDASVSFGRMHPYHSIAGLPSPSKDTNVASCWIGVDGEDNAARIAYELLLAAGAHTFPLKSVDATRYHASAAVLSNGAIALASIAENLLASSGVKDKSLQSSLLASILRSVADNVQAFGVTPSLSGPVRRGDLETVKRILASTPTGALSLVRESLWVQADIAESLGEENPASFQAIRSMLKAPKLP
ncbi:MAG: DUF2520 domain-containing protein [Polyangiaceae bacterium]|nr:DUF2520 domain-containing protein [Polyangiaceae bacterium]